MDGLQRGDWVELSWLALGLDGLGSDARWCHHAGNCHNGLLPAQPPGRDQHPQYLRNPWKQLSRPGPHLAEVR